MTNSERLLGSLTGKPYSLHNPGIFKEKQPYSLIKSEL